MTTQPTPRWRPLALAAVLWAGCASGGGKSIEDGGGSKGNGGTASTGASTSQTGGQTGAGGSKASTNASTGTGGTTTPGGSGGSVASTGGQLGTAGATTTTSNSTGGAPGSGGTSASGGTTARSSGGAGGGNRTASGGTTSSGGVMGRGGTTASGGATGSGGSGSGGAAGGTDGSLPWLKVVGNQIQVETTSQQVILRGISIEGLGQQSKDTKYNINGVIDLITSKNDTGGSSPGWYPVLLRLPVDSANASSEINSLLKPAVDYATKKGLYVIIDLHYVDNPYNNVQTVNSFWTTVAPMFKDYANVFYEPFNESSVQDSWATYKPTMQAWVNLIRGFAPKNLIFAGSPSWDQAMGDAASNPLTGGNIVYVVHMYYHHWITSWNKAQVEACAKVNPVVMTEWGYNNSASETETDPDISATYGKPMLQWLEALGGSWTAWCASNSWLPRMFGDNWTLLVGPREEGGFVKDWLYTNRNVKSPIVF